MPPGSARRAASVLAPASLFFGELRAVAAASAGPIWHSVVVGSGFALVLALAVAAATLRTERALRRVDVATLVSALAITTAQFSGVTSGIIGQRSDEQVLDQLAQRLVNHGHNPYGQVFRLVGADGSGTPLFGGGNARTFGYPPFALEVGRVLSEIAPRFGSPGVVELLGLALLAVVCFALTPTSWRGLSVVAVLGLPLATGSAVAGYFVVLAAALMAPALARWTTAGRGGRLGRAGVAQAVCLGLACATHQLMWFPAIFVLVGIYLVRHGELGARAAAGVTARYTAIAVAVFALVNAPFVYADPRAWAHGMAVTFTQHAVIAGGSWGVPLIVAHGGSGTLALLDLAAPLSLAASLIVFVFGVRRLAPALAILPSLVFLLAARSDVEYFYALAPIWIVSVAGVDQALVARAWRPRASSVLSRLVGTRPRRLALAVVVWVPAVAVFAAGVTGAPSVTAEAMAATVSGSRITTLTVRVVNHTGRPLRPQFFVDPHTSVVHPWVPPAGSAEIAPHATSVIVLSPISVLEHTTVAPNLWIYSTVSDPESISARAITLPVNRITVLNLSRTSALARASARCVALQLTGRNHNCSSQVGLYSATG